MALAFGIGADDDERPLGELGQRGPDLLSRHQPASVLEAGAGGHVGQVGAGVGLGVALTPELVAGEDPRDEPMLLLDAAEGQERRSEQRQPDVGEPSRGTGLDVGLVEHHLLEQGGSTATQLRRIVEPQPAARGELPLPGDEDLGGDVLATRAAASPQASKVADEVLLEPGSGLVREGEFGRAERGVHGVDRTGQAGGESRRVRAEQSPSSRFAVCW